MTKHQAEIITFPSRGAPAAEPGTDAFHVMPDQLTMDMIDAAGHAMDDYRRSGGKGFIGMMQAMWEAMKAAAPEPEDAA